MNSKTKRTKKTKKTKKTKQTKRRNRKTKKGGVLLFKTDRQDIMPELQRFSNGEIDYLSNGKFGLILKLTSQDSEVLSGVQKSINSILIKVVTLDSDLEYNNVSISRVRIDDFEKEVHFQQEISASSLEKFGCSIVPTILFAEIYTPEELMKRLPNIARQFKTVGKIGIIFMEHVKNARGELAYPVDNYFRQNDTYFFTIMLPIARRLLIMLGQLGFLHNDFHLGNILFTGNALLMIDFGKATMMSEESLNTFNRELEMYERNKNPLRIIEILYGRNVPEIDVPEEDVKYYLARQWLGQNQLEIYVPEIDPTIKIAPEISVVEALRLNEEQRQKTISFPLIPYVEREKEEMKKETYSEMRKRMVVEQKRRERETQRYRAEYNEGKDNYSESEREEQKRLDRMVINRMNESRKGIIKENVQKVTEERERERIEKEKERIEKERIEREERYKKVAEAEREKKEKLAKETPEEKKQREEIERIETEKLNALAAEWGFGWGGGKARWEPL